MLITARWSSVLFVDKRDVSCLFYTQFPLPDAMKEHEFELGESTFESVDFVIAGLPCIVRQGKTMRVLVKTSFATMTDRQWPRFLGKY